MKFRECMQELKRLLKNNKWMIVFLIIVLFIRIKNSEVPVIKLISNIPIITTILLKPRENTVYAEVIDFFDILGMSFLASLVFLFFSVTFPNMKKSKWIRRKIKERIKHILKNIKDITIECVGFYHQSPQFPKNTFENYNDEDIRWILDNVAFDKPICLQEGKYILGYQYMYEKAEEIKEEIENILVNYLEYISNQENEILNELLNCKYLQGCIKRYQSYSISGQVEIPRETLEEAMKVNPKMITMGGIVIGDCTIEDDDIKNGIEIYKKVQKIWKLTID